MSLMHNLSGKLKPIEVFLILFLPESEFSFRRETPCSNILGTLDGHLLMLFVTTCLAKAPVLSISGYFVPTNPLLFCLNIFVFLVKFRGGTTLDVLEFVYYCR